MPSARRSSRVGVDGQLDRARAARRPTPRGSARPGRRSVSTASRNRFILWSAAATLSARSSRNRAVLPATPSKPSGEPDPVALQGAEVEVVGVALGVVAADELHRGLVPGGARVGHLVDRPRQPAGVVEPPEDVHPAVAPRHPGVPADREDDLPPGAVQLVGDLHAGRRGAHDEDAAGGELAGVAVAVRGQHLGAGAGRRPAGRTACRADRWRRPRGGSARCRGR